ncbi:Uncharacterized protein Fot_04957 [Forsythia ovata]|uniref:Uncharacterized protein n=1 Tax=Forsythia ovata TaxID=205694 RepID=A0ABD1WNS5_9LAMI
MDRPVYGNEPCAMIIAMIRTSTILTTQAIRLIPPLHLSDKALLKIWGKKKVMLPVREADLSIVKYHKSAIKMTKTRIEIIRKKRNAMHKYLRNDIGDLLKNGLDINA